MSQYVVKGVKMLRDRLKDMELKLTELADYMQISRPTLYKFIECYDNQEFEFINNKVLKLFNYITENEFIGKKTVISYILNNLVEVKPLGEKHGVSVVSRIKKYILENPESKKSKFFEVCITSHFFDEVIFNLVDIAEIARKGKRSEEEKRKLELYRNFVDELKFLYS